MKKLKQFYTDLYDRSAMEYWKGEGNNKRMQKYHKVSNILKVVKQIIFLLTTFIFVNLVTQSLIYLTSVNIININKFIAFILDVYNICIITLVFAITLIAIKKKCIITLVFAITLIAIKKKNIKSTKEIIMMFICGILLIPEIVLLIIHFAVFSSLMSSFYYLVVTVAMILIVNSITVRIDKLYELATGENELKTKGKGKRR